MRIVGNREAGTSGPEFKLLHTKYTAGNSAGVEIRRVSSVVVRQWLCEAGLFSDAMPPVQMDRQAFRGISLPLRTLAPHWRDPQSQNYLRWQAPCRTPIRGG